MSARKLKPPSYCLHKATGQARVVIDGRTIYLGKYDTDESRDAYNRIIAEWYAHGGLPEADDCPSDFTINELFVLYWEFVQGYYRKDGEPTGEQQNIQNAIQPLQDLYGDTPVTAFGPRALAACAELLGPLYDLMKRRILASKVIHTDDTPVPVQDKDRNKTRLGRVWVYVGDKNHPLTVFDYTASRSRDGPMAFLDGFEGYLQADAFSGYDAIYAGGKVIEVACWAHARRKFVEAEETDPKRAYTAVAMIRLLYDVEDEANDLDTEARRALRQEKSLPRLEQIEAWLHEERNKVLPKSPIGQAINYALSNWEALTVYTSDGNLAVDNNAAENALRGVVIGRKNWLFFGSDKGGRTAAILTSFIATCKRHGIDPFAYLRDVLTRISATPVSQLDQFLPDRWVAGDSARN